LAAKWLRHLFLSFLGDLTCENNASANCFEAFAAVIHPMVICNGSYWDGTADFRSFFCTAVRLNWSISTQHAEPVLTPTIDQAFTGSQTF
jgi:hypothetical protein